MINEKKGVVARAKGKLILFGEHAVVYGEPAVVAGVGLGVEVKIQISKSKFQKSGVSIESVGVGKVEVEVGELLGWVERLQALHKKCEQKGDFSSLWAKIGDDSLWVVKVVVGMWLSEKSKIKNQKSKFNSKSKKGRSIFRENDLVNLTQIDGLKMVIESQIPVGSGMGSSAAVAAVVMKGLDRWQRGVFRRSGVSQNTRIAQDDDSGMISFPESSNGEGISKDRLCEMVFEVEKLVHGKPSGIDNTAVVYGGLIRFQRKANGIEIAKAQPKKRLPEVILVQSGVPVENTGQMVQMVREKYGKYAEIKRVIREIGEVGEKAWIRLIEGDLDAELVRKNQKLLEEVGVVGDKAKKIVREVEELGGVAKVCGAGGVKEGSGMVMVVGGGLEKVERWARRCGLEWWRVGLGRVR